MIRSGSISTRWTAIDAGMKTLGWLQLRNWSTSTDAVLHLLARQYLVLGALTAALVALLVVSAQHQLRLQSRQREQRLQQEKADLEQTALTDPLTGVWNRRGVERELGMWIDQPLTGNPQRVAICMIDLDDFKPVNDTYGHAIGDQVLIAVTRRIRSLLREGDLLGRIGGDELITVFRNCAEPEIAQRLGIRIVNALKKPFILGDLEVRLGASIGIALNARDGSESRASLLQRADQAMYEAKHAGKGQLVLAGPPPPH